MRPLIDKRKEAIAKRKRYGKNPLVVSSGAKVTWEDYPKNMKLNLDPEVIQKLS